jgi:hypothetical protein
MLRITRRSLSCPALLLAVAAASAPATALAEETQKQGGFVLFTELGATFNLFSTLGAASNNAAPASASPSGGLGFGFKSGSFVFTMGLDLANVTSSGSGFNSDFRATVFQFTPGVQYALLRSPDGRVELPLCVQMGLGTYVTSGGNGGSKPFILSYRIAPGARYWVHPHLALQLLAGYSGTAVFDTSSPSSGNISVHGVSSHFGALAVF